MKLVARIYWQQVGKESFLYGGYLRFACRERVLWQNAGMPFGERIHAFTSKKDFLKDKELAECPILTAGQELEFQASYEAEPRGSIVLEVSFYDLLGQTLATFHAPDVLRLTVPARTDHYVIALINAGCRELEFHYVLIRDLSSESASSQVYGPESASLARNLIREISPNREILPLFFLEPSLVGPRVSRRACKEQQGLSLFSSDFLCHGFMDPAWRDFMESLVETFPDRQFLLWGQGPIGNRAAAYYCSLSDRVSAHLNRADLAMPCYLGYMTEAGLDRDFVKGSQAIYEEAIYGRSEPDRSYGDAITRRITRYGELPDLLQEEPDLALFLDYAQAGRDGKEAKVV